MSHPRVPLTGLVLSLAVACSSAPADPAGRLASAVSETVATEFAYDLTVDAAPEALGSLDDASTGGTSELLSSLRVAGVVEGERAASIAVTLVGESPVVEVRSISDEAVYARLGLGDLLASTGGGEAPPAERIEPLLAMLGLAPRAQEVVVAALDGEWVGVEGEIDAARLGALVGPSASPGDAEAEEDVRRQLGGDLPGFVQRFITVTDEREQEDGRVYDVELELRELVRALGGIGGAPGGGFEAALDGLPPTVPGTVETRAGLVTLMSFDVAGAAREAGREVDGAISIDLALSDHGAVEPVAPPDDAVTMTGEQLDDMVLRLDELGEQFPAR